MPEVFFVFPGLSIARKNVGISECKKSIAYAFEIRFFYDIIIGR
jgi:hypothetical protein